MEVLAPAGGREQLIAAVYSGADAVYLGTKGFNARRKADNFGEDELKQAVAFCHGRGVRVHVTVNTLVTDSELPALWDTVREVAESGADAVILQDLAAAALFREHVPDLPRHASTQMSIHNAEGARLAQELGFSRVILARELSLAEIRRIREAVDIWASPASACFPPSWGSAAATGASAPSPAAWISGRGNGAMPFP